MRVWLYRLLGFLVIFSLGEACQDRHEHAVIYIQAPIQDLIVNPMRYKDRGVKTFGFVLRSEDGFYYLASQRDRAMIFDNISRIALNPSQSDEPLAPEFVGHLVYLEGRFIVQGDASDYPGTLSRRIIVDEIWSPEVVEGEIHD